MKFFVDDADLREIETLQAIGLCDGVTTNPSIIAKSGRDFFTVIKEIAKQVPGPVSAEVIATDFDGMLREGQELAALAPNVTVKVPLTYAGLKACRSLRDKGVMVNITLCFSVPQAILAAKAGATFVSPFMGRLDDIGVSGTDLVQEICGVFDQYDTFQTEVLAASIRHPMHIVEAAHAGAHVVTAPPKVFHQLYKHPLTESGLQKFLADWQQSKKP